jgi:hypothetical protein
MWQQCHIATHTATNTHPHLQFVTTTMWWLCHDGELFVATTTLSAPDNDEDE